MTVADWLFALAGGLAPAFIWVLFWLLEDRAEPEPKRYIFITFTLGMLAVVLVLPLEQGAMRYLTGTGLLLAWAALEECFKFGAAYLGGLRLRVFDEPLDAVVYMVTAALGFSALENVFFLVTPLSQGDVLRTLATGDLRFMGAMLLHTLASATVGVFLALSFYKGAAARRSAALFGLILAIILHTAFNFFILGSGSSATFWIFLVLWCGIVVLLLMTERVKGPKDYRR